MPQPRIPRRPTPADLREMYESLPAIQPPSDEELERMACYYSISDTNERRTPGGPFTLGQRPRYSPYER